MGKTGTRILITGATGFIGANLSKRLVENGTEVHALVRGNVTDPWLSAQLQGAILHPTNCSTECIVRLVKEISPETVFHLAAKASAEHSEHDLDEHIESNFSLTCRLLEGMKQSGSKKLVNAGTFWQRNDRNTYEPYNLYAAMKQASQDLITYYANAANISAISLLLADTYGAGDRRPKIINLLLASLSSSQRLDLTPGQQYLDLVHIDDIVEALLVAQNERCKEPGHRVRSVCSSSPIRLIELATLIEELSGVTLNVRWGAKPYRARETMNPRAIADILEGWSPKRRLEDELRRLLPPK